MMQSVIDVVKLFPSIWRKSKILFDSREGAARTRLVDQTSKDFEQFKKAFMNDERNDFFTTDVFSKVKRNLPLSRNVEGSSWQLPDAGRFEGRLTDILQKQTQISEYDETERALASAMGVKQKKGKRASAMGSSDFGDDLAKALEMQQKAIKKNPRYSPSGAAVCNIHVIFMILLFIIVVVV
eukprot:UN12659